MKLWKKCILLCAALSLCVSVISSAVACGSGQTASSSESPSSSTEEESGSDGDDGGDNVDDGCEHTWGEWTAVSQPDCDTAGEKQRICSKDSSHVDKADIPARGHDYTANNGVCHCGHGPVVPTAASSITYKKPGAPDSGIVGTGKPFEWYELSEGYLEVECLGEDNPVWLSFSVKGAGQYALHSIDGAKGTKVQRHDASISYIPEDENGYIGFDARILTDGNLYSIVNCSPNYYSPYWRATYSISGAAGTLLKLRFVKIADAPWTPNNIIKNVYATELSEKAEDAEKGFLLADVPYDTSFFFDEECGYYRMGTKENPKEIIYAAISAPAKRLFGGASFTKIQLEGKNLSVFAGTTVDGDYLIHNYAGFIMSDPNYGGVEKSYQNYVNSDGVYPVNKELYEFLTLYTKEKRPVEIPDDVWANNVSDPRAWLSACYYYKEAVFGTEEFPFEIGEGTFENSFPKYGEVYYKILLSSNTLEMVVCTLTFTNPNLYVFVGDICYDTTSSIALEVNVAKGTTIRIAAKTPQAAEFSFTVTAAE